MFAFLVSELSCGVHAVLAISEWGEQSAGGVVAVEGDGRTFTLGVDSVMLPAGVRHEHI